MIYLDNDCLITLAELNLIQFFCEVYDIAEKWSVTILRECEHQVGEVRGARAKRDFVDFCRRHLYASDTWAPEEYALVRDLSGAIHEEAILIASCLKDADDSSILTGDINAIKAFAKTAPDPVLKKLYRRVLLIEHVILDVLYKIDHERIYRALEDSSCDHRIFGCVSSMSIDEMKGYLSNKSTERSSLVQPLFPQLR